MTNQSDVEAILVSIKNRRKLWRLSSRRINLITLSLIGFTETSVLDEIYTKLTYQNYVSGPELDNHQPPRPGEVWIFGLTISGIQCYLKFKDKPDHTVFWISLHQAAFPMTFPFR
ncbi:hypothetical protein [Secundilactobacillus muriivasis]